MPFLQEAKKADAEMYRPEPLQYHRGEDYAVLMREEDTTDTALINFQSFLPDEADYWGNLIIAAPELYAESKRNVLIMKTMLEYLRQCNPESVHTVTLEGQIKATSAAIDQARGE